MDRRSFLRLVSMGVIGAELDIDKLLWIPKVMITVPAKPEIITGGAITLHMIQEFHKNLVLGQIHRLFEKDDLFYAEIMRKK